MVDSQSSSSAAMSRFGVVAVAFEFKDDSPKEGRIEANFLAEVEEADAESADPAEEDENLDLFTDSVVVETSCHCFVSGLSLQSCWSRVTPQMLFLLATATDWSRPGTECQRVVDSMI